MAGATLTWATLALLGLGRLARLAWLTVAAKLVGAASLVCIGCRLIAGSRRPAPAAGSMPNARHGGWMAPRRGYPCSMTNPKAAAFFGSIFVVMLPAHAPGWVYGAAVAWLSVLSAGWHCGLAVVFSVAPVQAGAIVGPRARSMWSLVGFWLPWGSFSCRAIASIAAFDFNDDLYEVPLNPESGPSNLL